MLLRQRCATQLVCYTDRLVAFRTGIFAALFSALGHDVAHPGRNNAFLVKTQSVLALRYNDVHVLENMHASTLFQILQVRPAHAAATNNQATRSVAKPASRCPCSRRRNSARTLNHNWMNGMGWFVCCATGSGHQHPRGAFGRAKTNLPTAIGLDGNN